MTSRHSISQPERLDTALQEHKAIYDAIVAKDKEKAKEMIQKHIRSTQMLVRHFFDEKGQN